MDKSDRPKEKTDHIFDGTFKTLTEVNPMAWDGRGQLRDRKL